MKKNVASQAISAQLVSSSDGSAVTAGTTIVYVTGDGGTQAAGTGTVTHEGQGSWSYVPTQAETNYDHIAFTFANSSAISVTANVYTQFPQTGDSFDRIGTSGAGLTSLPWNSSWDTEVQSEVNDALVALHLDRLLAADYDPSSKPGVSTALLNELVENDGGVSRFTANALEQGPTDVNVTSMGSNVLTAAALAADAVAEIWAQQVESEGTYTAQEAMSICLAVLAGQTSNSGNTISTPNGNATRVAATVSSNERTGMTLTPSS